MVMLWPGRREKLLDIVPSFFNNAFLSWCDKSKEELLQHSTRLLNRPHVYCLKQ